MARKTKAGTPAEQPNEKTPAVWTPEQIKALIDELTPDQKMHLCYLLQDDFHVNYIWKALLGNEMVQRHRVEIEKGIAPGMIDPDNLLRQMVRQPDGRVRRETAQEAAKRIGSNENAINVARSRLKDKLNENLASAVEMDYGGNITKITPQPPMQGTRWKNTTA